MKKTMVRIFAAVLVLAMAIGFLAMIPASAATESVQIMSNNVLYNDYLQLMYALYIPSSAGTVTVELYDSNGYWCTAEPYMVDSTAVTTEIDGITCAVYAATSGVPLQDIDAVATAKVLVDGVVVDECTYSVLEYLHERQTLLGAGLKEENGQANKLAMYASLLEASAAMQVVLDGSSTIGNYGYVYVINGTINSEQSALLQVGKTITKDDLDVDGVAKSWQYKTVGGEFTDLPEEGLTIGNNNYILTAEIEEPTEPSEPSVPDETEPVQAEATITFDSTSKNTEFDSTSHLIWEEDGIVVTNKKGSYASSLAQYANPARFYKGTTLTIEHFDMKQIVFNCNTAEYATALGASIEAAVVEGKSVTVVFDTVTQTVTYTMSAQVRVDSIVVTYVACPHNNTASVAAKDATCTETGIAEGTVICNDCLAYISGGVIAANGHDYDSEITQDATCTVAGETTYTCSVCNDSYTEEIKALGHSYVDGACERCGEADPNAGGETDTPITASKTIAELITQYGWTSSTTKQSFNLDDNVSVKIAGGSNTGKAYNDDHIRIYATDSPAGTMTISVPEGYELVSIKISTQTGTYAYLYVDGTTTDISNETVEVSGNSVLLKSVKNGSNGKQVRITAIEVVYKAI